MAAKPKLSPAQWAEVRSRWEGDSREGYTWLVDEMSLPVSAPGVRKTALREGWVKAGASKGDTRATEAPTRASKGRKVSKVSENHQGEVSETMPETIETMSEARPPVTAAEAVERDPDRFGVLSELTDKQEIFVREYMVDWNATQAAIRAGYSVKSAPEISGQLLRKTHVRQAIETLASARARRLGIDAEELMRLWSSIVMTDANELSQFRRVCCPHCWGNEHQRQYTPEGLAEARRKHERERARMLKDSGGEVDIGEFPEYEDPWYDKRKEPHPDCPECFGEGRGETFFNDTRKLSPGARLLYGGVKEGRDGLEFIVMSKEKAMDNLARALGLFKEKDADVTINMVSGDELYRIYEDKMRQARERQALVLAERGLIEPGEG